VSDELDRVAAVYDRLAPRYDRSARLVERWWIDKRRARLCAQATGNVLEIALGTGLNLPHYPPGVWLTGIDLSAGMLAQARERADALGIHADLRLGNAEALDFADQTFDSVVSTMSLCTIPDDRRALAEAWRVLERGGRLLLLEHVRSPLLLVRQVERVLEPLALRSDADHLLRDPLDHLAGLGFVIEQLDRAVLGLLELVVARKP
jgi:ubiquinone/menaquinone biosynthesis C-methylase UbiE